MERWQMYRDTGVTKVERVTVNNYSSASGVDRHHLISISSYLIIQWKYTLYLSQLLVPFGLSTLSWIVGIAWDPQRRVVSYLLTPFLLSTMPNRSLCLITFGCCKRCTAVLMVFSLPTSSITSPQWPPSCATLIILNGRVLVLLQLNSSTICGQIDCMYI